MSQVVAVTSEGVALEWDAVDASFVLCNSPVDNQSVLQMERAGSIRWNDLPTKHWAYQVLGLSSAPPVANTVVALGTDDAVTATAVTHMEPIAEDAEPVEVVPAEAQSTPKQRGGILQAAALVLCSLTALWFVMVPSTMSVGTGTRGLAVYFSDALIQPMWWIGLALAGAATKRGRTRAMRLSLSVLCIGFALGAIVTLVGPSSIGSDQSSESLSGTPAQDVAAMFEELRGPHKELQTQVYLWASLVKDYQDGKVSYEQYSQLAPTRMSDCDTASNDVGELTKPFIPYVDDPEAGPLVEKIIESMTLKRTQVVQLKEMHRGILEIEDGQTDVGNARLENAANRFGETQTRYQQLGKEMMALADELAQDEN